jgi:hypothetical protein
MMSMPRPISRYQEIPRNTKKSQVGGFLQREKIRIAPNLAKAGLGILNAPEVRRTVGARRNWRHRARWNTPNAGEAGSIGSRASCL